jgi:hypothetical protein
MPMSRILPERSGKAKNEAREIRTRRTIELATADLQTDHDLRALYFEFLVYDDELAISHS